MHSQYNQYLANVKPMQCATRELLRTSSADYGLRAVCDSTLTRDRTAKNRVERDEDSEVGELEEKMNCDVSMKEINEKPKRKRGSEEVIEKTKEKIEDAGFKVKRNKKGSNQRKEMNNRNSNRDKEMNHRMK